MPYSVWAREGLKRKRRERKSGRKADNEAAIVEAFSRALSDGGGGDGVGIYRAKKRRGVWIQVSEGCHISRCMSSVPWRSELVLPHIACWDERVAEVGSKSTKTRVRQITKRLVSAVVDVEGSELGSVTRLKRILNWAGLS